MDHAVSEEEIQAAALQFVRKISGYRKPSRANEAVFAAAVDEITAASRRLLEGLSTRGTHGAAGYDGATHRTEHMAVP
jgi:hypothetical protein